MPVPGEITRLKEMGFDPQYHTIRPDGTVWKQSLPVKRKIIKPVVEAPLESTLGGTIKRSALRSAIPSIGSLAVTGVALASGVGTIPVIAAAIASGVGLGMAQDKIDPLTEDEIRQMLADRAAHPVGQVVGEILPSALALRPSPSGIKSAFTGVAGKLRGGRKLLNTEKAHLTNMGVSAALGGTFEAGFGATLGEGVDAKRVLAATLGGGLMTTPTAIGKKMGFPTLGDPSKVRVQAKPTPFEPVTMADGEVVVPRDAEHREQLVTMVKNAQKVKLDEAVRAEESAVRQKAFEQAEADAAGVRGNAEALEGNAGDAKPKFNRFGRKEPVRDKELTFEQKAFEVETNETAPPGVPRGVLDDATEWNKISGQTGAKLPVEGQPVADPSVAQTEAEFLSRQHGDGVDGVRFQERGNLQSESIRKLLDALGLDLDGASTMTVRDLMVAVAAKREVVVLEGNVKAATGTDATGAAFLRERLALIDPDHPLFGPDTELHEVAHVFLRDLQEGGSRFERKLVEQGIKAFGGEEALVEGIGLKGTSNLLKGDGPLEFLKDFWSHVKVRFGKGSDKDINRLLSRKVLDDPAFDHNKMRIAHIDVDRVPSGALGAKFLDHFTVDGNIVRHKMFEDYSVTKGVDVVAQGGKRVEIKGFQIRENGDLIATAKNQADADAFIAEQIRESRGDFIKGLEHLQTQTGKNILVSDAKFQGGGGIESVIIERSSQLVDAGRGNRLPRSLPELGGVRSVLDELPATEVMNLLGRHGLDTARLYDDLSRVNIIGGEASKGPRPIAGETLQSYRKRVGIGQIDDLDTRARTENPETGALESVGDSPIDSLTKKLGIPTTVEELGKSNMRFQDGSRASDAKSKSGFAKMRAKTEEAKPATPDDAGKPTPKLSAADRAMQGEFAKLDNPNIMYSLGSRVNREAPGWATGANAGSRSKLSYAARDGVPEKQKFGFFEVLESMVDKVKGKQNVELGEAFGERARLQVRYTGELVDVVVYDMEHLPLKRGELGPALDRIREFRQKRWTGEESDIRLTPTELSIMENHVEAQYLKSRQFQNEAGLTVKDGENFREGGFNKEYENSMLDVEVGKQIRDNPRSAETVKLKEELAEFWVKRSEAIGRKTKEPYTLSKAQEDVDNYFIALGVNRDGFTHEHFNALRMAQGLGLPWKMVDKSGMSSMTRYGSRAAHDLAYFKALQDNPRVRSMLNLPDQKGLRTDNPSGLTRYEGTREVKDLMRYLTRETSGFDDVVMSANRVAVASFLGPVSVMRDVVSSWSNSLPYMRLQDTHLFIKAIGSLSSGWRKSFEFGVNRSSALSREYQASAVSNLTNKFTNIANMISTFQLRNKGEQLSRALTFVHGEMLAHANAGRARGGDAQAIQWLKEFGGPGFDIDAFKQRGSLLPKESGEMGAAFTERIQGSYDERGIPSWAASGVGQPFFGLARWSIEKSNTIYKDVIAPLGLKKGSGGAQPGAWKRLMGYTLGSVLGGEVIHQLSEIMNNKANQAAGLTEEIELSIEAPEMSTVGDKVETLVHLMQLSGTGGIMSDILASMSSVSEGDMMRGFDFPLQTVLQDGLAKNIANLSEAIDRGTAPYDAYTIFVAEVYKDIAQSGRLFYNFLHEEEMRQKDVRRDVRQALIRTEGSSTQLGLGDNNPMLSPQTRAFKNARTGQGANAHLDAAIAEQMRMGGNNPIQVAKNVNSLRNISSSTLPDPENNPMRYNRVLDFLEATKGRDEMQRVVEEYQQQQLLNDAKKGLVPRVQVPELR